jgi:hypothetical protein
MSLFSNILAKIFPPSHPAVTAQAAPAAPTANPGAPVASTATAPATATDNAPAPAQATAAPAAAPEPVDVEAVISKMPGASTLNWKTSIVDLLKVLGLDSSLDARKQLARELGYGGSTDDSAAMNMWLHKEVVAKLAANGGKLPASMMQ